ncbi:MAG: vWA domain-containing protein, partial [Planctomycetota bacterium]
AGTNIRLAREACLQAAEALSPRDVVGVVGFDTKPAWVAEFTQADDLAALTDRVQRLLAGGGTDVHAALVQANHIMSQKALASFGIRHVVLFSDGETPQADFASVIARMRESSVTVSTICIASGEFDTQLMSRIAASGGGRFLFTNSFRNLPRLFVEETRRIVGEAVKKEGKAPPMPRPEEDPGPPEPGAPTGTGRTIVVAVRDEHDVLRGIDRDAIPPLDGALAGKARATAFVPLAAEDGTPVLAAWRYGLGKVAVWTSDLRGRWSAKWLEWKDAPKIFSQLVRYLSGPAEVQAIADRLRIERRGRDVTVRFSGADDSETIRGLPLRRSGDTWMGTLRLDRAGEVMPLRFVWNRGDRVERLSTAVAMGCEPEFDPRFGDVIRASVPRERVVALDALPSLTLPGRAAPVRRDWTPWLLLAALLLLPVDVVLRRVR